MEGSQHFHLNAHQARRKRLLKRGLLPSPSRTHSKSQARAKRIRYLPSIVSLMLAHPKPPSLSPLPPPPFSLLSSTGTATASPRVIQVARTAWLEAALGLLLYASVICVSVAVALALVLLPISRSFEKVVGRATSFHTHSGVYDASSLNRSGSIFCNTIGFANFAVYAAKESYDEVSLGETFFDCLKDLHATRYHAFLVKRIHALADEVMQFEHLLESPEELSEATSGLAHARRSLLLSANAARLSGERSVRKVVEFYYDSLDLLEEASSAPADDVGVEWQDGLEYVQDGLKDMAEYTSESSKHTVKAFELARIVAKSAQKELGRLKRITSEQETPDWYDTIRQALQPGFKGLKKDREQARKFLNEIILNVDEGGITLLASKLVFQQCVPITKILDHQIEKRFALKNSHLSLESRLHRLAPLVTSLESGLQVMQRSSGSKNRSPPPPASKGPTTLT